MWHSQINLFGGKIGEQAALSIRMGRGEGRFQRTKARCHLRNGVDRIPRSKLAYRCRSGAQRHRRWLVFSWVCEQRRDTDGSIPLVRRRSTSNEHSADLGSPGYSNREQPVPRRPMSKEPVEPKEMPAEVDFTKGVRRRHQIPPGAKVLMPASIEKSVWTLLFREGRGTWGPIVRPID